jgi:hypothetical protein
VTAERSGAAASGFWSLRHPHLALYLAGLLMTWTVSAATWAIAADGRIALSPLALVFQYLIVVAGSVLAGDRLLRASADHEADEATVAFMRVRQNVASRFTSRAPSDAEAHDPNSH